MLEHPGMMRVMGMGLVWFGGLGRSIPARAHEIGMGVMAWDVIAATPPDDARFVCTFFVNRMCIPLARVHA